MGVGSLLPPRLSPSLAGKKQPPAALLYHKPEPRKPLPPRSLCRDVGGRASGPSAASPLPALAKGPPSAAELGNQNREKGQFLGPRPLNT